MTTVASTFDVPVAQSGTTAMPMQVFDLEARFLWSVMLGIEQARRNEGTFLTDADLAQDDDE